jgi:hypothetical protein
MSVMNVVELDSRPHFRIICSGVDSANIARFMRKVEKIIILDQMVIAVVLNRGKRGIVDAVVRHDVSHSVEKDPSVEGLKDPAKAMDVIVDRKIPCRCESCPVSADNTDSGRADVIDVTALNAIVFASVMTTEVSLSMFRILHPAIRLSRPPSTLTAQAREHSKVTPWICMELAPLRQIIGSLRTDMVTSSGIIPLGGQK